MKPSPLVAIIVGSLVLLGSIYGLIHLTLIDPPKPLEASAIKTVSGKVTTIKEVRTSSKGIALDVALDGHKAYYRCNHMREVNKEALSKVSAGQDAEIGVSLDDAEMRHHDYSERDIIPLVSLRIGEQDVFTLDAYNARRMNNATIAKLYLLPFMCVAGLYVLIQGVRGKRLGLSHAPGMF